MQTDNEVYRFVRKTQCATRPFSSGRSQVHGGPTNVVRGRTAGNRHRTHCNQTTAVQSHYAFAIPLHYGRRTKRFKNYDFVQRMTIESKRAQVEVLPSGALGLSVPHKHVRTPPLQMYNYTTMTTPCCHPIPESLRAALLLPRTNNFTIL
jgi:hypothetical protein